MIGHSNFLALAQDILAGVTRPLSSCERVWTRDYPLTSISSVSLTSFSFSAHRQFGAIPVLVSQLRNPDHKVQVSVLGALRNLSFGRSNEENKLEIAGEHGLSEIMLALRMSRVPEVSCVWVCG